MAKKRQPSTKTLESVFNWLAEQGLSVYGPAVDLKQKRYHFGCQDYDVLTAITYARVKDTMKEPSHDD